MKALEQHTDLGGPALGEMGPLRPRTLPLPARLGVDRYSRGVALLKLVLPAIGGALLLLVAMWPRLVPLIESVRLAVSAIDLRAARELKMVNPRYAGTDRLNRPFVVTAAIGRQLPSRSDLMSLEDPRAVMIVHGGARVVLTAATGIYQSQPQLLDLFDNVVLTHQNGTRFVTRRAHADFASNTAEGHDPIEGHGPSGDIWGQGFHVLDKGDTIIFTGHSHAILKGTKPAKPASPPQLPAHIVTTAAAIEAAAVTTAAPANPPPAPTSAAKRVQAEPVETRHSVIAPRSVLRLSVPSPSVKAPKSSPPSIRKADHDAD